MDCGNNSSQNVCTIIPVCLKSNEKPWCWSRRVQFSIAEIVNLELLKSYTGINFTTWLFIISHECVDWVVFVILELRRQNISVTPKWWLSNYLYSNRINLTSWLIIISHECFDWMVFVIVFLKLGTAKTEHWARILYWRSREDRHLLLTDTCLQVYLI